MSQERGSPTTRSRIREPGTAPACSRSGWAHALWLTAAAAALILTGAGCRSTTAEAPNPAPVVTVTHPVMRSVKDYLDLTGNTAAIDSVTWSRASRDTWRKFTSWTAPRSKKATCFSRFSRISTAQLQQAQAQVSAQKAALWHAQDRVCALFESAEEDAATQTEVDQWHYEREAAAAEVIGAQAQVEIAQLNLSYTTFTRRSTAGSDVISSTPAIWSDRWASRRRWPTSTRSIRLYVYFTINERDLLRIVRMRQSAGLPIAQPVIPVYFGLSDEEELSSSGPSGFRFDQRYSDHRHVAGARHFPQPRPCDPARTVRARAA